MNLSQDVTQWYKIIIQVMKYTPQFFFQKQILSTKSDKIALIAASAHANVHAKVWVHVQVYIQVCVCAIV